MPAFISYNRNDKRFAEGLASRLVAEGHNIWIDNWELNVGDSLIDRIQGALEDASAVIAVLSRTSVQSDWCRKEINSTLVRELDKSGSLLLPCVIEDCEIPLFLREKVYADFRSDPAVAYKQLSNALLRFSNKHQSRFNDDHHHVDYSFSHGADSEGVPFGEWMFVQHSTKLEYSVVTAIRAFFDEAGGERWKLRKKQGTENIFLAAILEIVLQTLKGKSFVLDDAIPQIKRIGVADVHGFSIEIVVETRRLGIDNGKSTLVRVASLIAMAKRQLLADLRKAMDAAE